MQVTVWKFVGGRACLDFVNTVGGRQRAVVIREKLHSYDDLLAWSEAAGLITQTKVRKLAEDAVGNPRVAGDVLSRALALREALYLLFQGKKLDDGMQILNREVAIARDHEILHRTRKGFEWRWDASGSLDCTLWPVSRSAAGLLTSSDIAKVRRCGGEDCGWLFLDTSRNHKRHWCDMRDCGNRAKVKRFRDRQRTSYPGI